MNICLLTSTFLPLVGGMEIVVHNLATALTGLGHNVYLLTPYRKYRKTVDDSGLNYKVIRFGFRGYGRLKLTTLTAVLAMAYVVKRYEIDVINAHNVFTPGTWSYAFSRFNKHIPIIGTPHGDDIQVTPEIQDGVRLNPEADRIVRRNLNGFKCITAISSSIIEELIGIVGNGKKIFNVPNGVWVDHFRKKADRNAIRKQFGIPVDRPAVISVGRNHARKGFNYGLDAVAKLRQSGYKISYILVGRSMGPIIERAKSLSVSDSLITPGQVDPDMVAMLMQSSDIYLSPSIVESFGVATLEAMSAGLPCVVTDIAGSRDLVSRQYGMLVNPKDADQIATALKHLLDNPSLRKEMGIRASKEADKYDWPDVAKQYEKVYAEAINN